MMKRICCLLAMVVLTGLWTASSWAQQTNPPTGQTGSISPASPIGSSQTSVNAPNPNEGQPPASAPMAPLSGVQVLAPTFGGTSEDYWVPALACTENATTNPSGLNRGTGLFSQTTCAGNLTLQKVDRRSQLNLDFTGGGFYYNRPYETATKQYGTDEQLAVFEKVNGRRWTWMLGDKGTYLPDGSMGYGGLAGVSSFAGGLGGGANASAPALSQAFSPNQSIYAGMNRRFSDLALSEFSYVAGPRSTLTVTGMFGTLQFLTPGNIDERYWTVMTGYNRSFGRSNEFALNYEEMHFNFGASQLTFLTRGGSILYGRQISRKFAVDLSAAPMAREISAPGAGSTTNFYLGTYDSLNYRAERWEGTFMFDRSLAGGAGVLAGAAMNRVTGSLGRQLSRRVHGSVNLGYADNRSVAQSSSSAPVRTFDYEQAGANLTHELGRHMSLYLNYSVQRQTSNTPLCEGATCSKVFFRQIGGFGINWHTEPRKFR